MLTTHPLLVPRLRKSRSYTSFHTNAPLWSVTGPLYLFTYIYIYICICIWSSCLISWFGVGLRCCLVRAFTDRRNLFSAQSVLLSCSFLIIHASEPYRLVRQEMSMSCNTSGRFLSFLCRSTFLVLFHRIILYFAIPLSVYHNEERYRTVGN
jgi:hypothetical protein